MLAYKFDLHNILRCIKEVSIMLMDVLCCPVYLSDSSSITFSHRLTNYFVNSFFHINFLYLHKEIASLEKSSQDFDMQCHVDLKVFVYIFAASLSVMHITQMVAFTLGRDLPRDSACLIKLRHISNTFRSNCMIRIYKLDYQH